MMRQLDQQTAIITGASRGIGRALALALGRAGAQLVLVARSSANLHSVAAELKHQGSDVLAIPADVTDAAARSQIIEATISRFGAIDLLVNNAGQCDVTAFHAMDEERIDQILDLNLTAPLLLSRLALPHMLKQRRGHIRSHRPRFGRSNVTMQRCMSTRCRFVRCCCSRRSFRVRPNGCFLALAPISTAARYARMS